MRSRARTRGSRCWLCMIGLFVFFFISCPIGFERDVERGNGRLLEQDVDGAISFYERALAARHDRSLHNKVTILKYVKAVTQFPVQLSSLDVTTMDFGEEHADYVAVQLDKSRHVEAYLRQINRTYRCEDAAFCEAQQAMLDAAAGYIRLRESLIAYFRGGAPGREDVIIGQVRTCSCKKDRALASLQALVDNLV